MRGTANGDMVQLVGLVSFAREVCRRWDSRSLHRVITISDVGNFQISLVGTKHSMELIRVATLNSDGNLSIKQSETVSKLVDHTLAILRLTHDVGVDMIGFHTSRRKSIHGVRIRESGRSIPVVQSGR
jgi:hypothetical protein